VKPLLRDDDAIARPASSPENPLLVFQGHSGAIVTLHRQGQASVVRKCAADASGNARLLQQAEKQRRLFAFGVPVPRVIAQGAEPDGRAFFEMEYVPARTLGAIVAGAAALDWPALAHALDRMIWLFRTQAGEPIPPGAFAQKIADILGQCDTAETRILADALLRCDWTGIPSSPSHGDLTFENILIAQGGRVAFIDCDEPWVSSFWLDIAKLFQDAQGHWCLRALYRAETSRVALLNAVQKIERLLPALMNFAYRADSTLPARLPQLAALHLFRTVPYARDETTRRFALARMRTLLHIEAPS
jgi:aminoglycoside phosphotransferase (APT) family kinase protein